VSYVFCLCFFSPVGLALFGGGVVCIVEQCFDVRNHGVVSGLAWYTRNGSGFVLKNPSLALRGGDGCCCTKQERSKRDDALLVVLVLC
jgi:hypothetical protein